MKNIILISVLIVSLTMITGCKEDPFEPAPLEAKRIAEEGLVTYKTLASMNFEEHGFSDPSELASLTLGEGISIHYMDVPEISLHDITQHPDQLIKDGEEWMFEVLAGNTVKAAITVHNFNGSWKVTEMGNSEIMKSISEVKNRHMNENELVHDAYRVVRIPGMYHYWVSYKDNGRNRFVHVYDRPEHGHTKHSVQGAREVIADIIQSVKDFKSAVIEP